MMTQIKRIIIAVFFIWLVGCCPGTGRASDAIVLKMNHQFPPNTTGSAMDQWFADQVRQRTGGRVSIRIFWSDGLGDPRENPSLMARGAIDMAAMSPGYFPDEMPLLAAPNSIPMAMDNVCQARDIMNTLIEKIPEVATEAAQLGIRPLFFHVLNPYLLVSRAPIVRLSDLMGKRIRTWGRDMPDLFRSVGAKPVPLFLGDVYSAMKNGVIDACPFSLDLVLSYGIHKYAGHITEVILWEGPSWGVWISDAVWQSIPVDLQQIMTATAGEAGLMEIQKMRAAEQEARAQLKGAGVQFHQLPESDIELWQKKSPDFFNRLIKQMAPRGKSEAAAKMVTLWKSLRQNKKCP